MVSNKISPKFGMILSEKIMELGNLVVAGFVIGQFVSGNEVSISILLVGAAVAAFCYAVSYVIIK